MAEPAREDCYPCQGTGMGQTDYAHCRACRGRGWLMRDDDSDEEPDEPRYFERDEVCYD